MENNNLIQLKDITKTFKSVKALDKVNFSLNSGEIHALIGANGAGKSTLAKIISGIYKMDSGKYYFDGNEILSFSKKLAMDIGISMVMQETSLMPDLNVAENVFIHKYGKGFLFDDKKIIEDTELIFQRMKVPKSLHPRRIVRNVSMAEKQLVEIAKSLAQQSKIIIFDEPTSSLSPAEVNTLYKIIRDLKNSGKGIIYVSHRLEEIFALADNITILRDGKSIVEKRPIKDITQKELVRLMVGGELHKTDQTNENDGKKIEYDPAVEIIDKRDKKEKSILKIKKGVITGLTGLVGAGRTELAQYIFGLRENKGYELKIDNQVVQINSPKDAINKGIALIPENRGEQGLIKDFTTFENAMFSQLGINSSFFIDYKTKRGKLEDILSRLNLKTDVLNRNIMNLSGGMQQKIVVAKWLMLDPEIIILDEPTRGIDVGARAEIYQLLYSLRNRDVAILVISSDFEEILTISDRVAVMSEGIIKAELPGKELDKEKILMYALPRTTAKVIKRALNKMGSLKGHNPAFWVAVDNNNVFCLEATNNSELINLSSGKMQKVKETKIPSALNYIKGKMETPVKIKEDSGEWGTILIPIKGKNNQNHGLLGLSATSDKFDSISVEEVLNSIEKERVEIEKVLQGLELY